jgi:hypothetical protein
MGLRVPSSRELLRLIIWPMMEGEELLLRLMSKQEPGFSVEVMWITSEERLKENELSNNNEYKLCL